MKLIKHIIFVDVDAETKLMINSLTGTMDEIDLPIFETLSAWKALDNIIPASDAEQELYDNLKKRDYLVADDAEETKKKEEVLDALRSNHAHDRKSCRSMTFIMTYDCNFRCPYCFEGEANIKRAVMTPELIDAALQLTDDRLSNVLLFGGEPLLPKTKPALEYLISKIPDKTLDIITNGYYLEEFVDLLTTIKIGYIMVTLDGAEETHNSRRYLPNKKPTYQKILAGITKCLESGLTMRIRMNIPEGKVDESTRIQHELTARFSEYNDLLSFELSPMLEYTDKMKNEMITEMFCSSIEYDYAERMKRNRALGSTTPVISALAAGTPIRPLYSFCYAHENVMAVDPYGNIYTCLVTVGKDHMAAGKYYPTIEYKENSITNRNIDKVPQCRECIYSLLCGGGCPIRLNDYSDYFKPVCSSIKSQIHDLLPKLYKAERDHKQKAVA